MKGPHRLIDDEAFAREVGVDLRNEAETLMSHDVPALRTRVLSGAARGAVPRYARVPRGGGLGHVLTLVGVAGVVGAAVIAGLSGGGADRVATATTDAAPQTRAWDGAALAGLPALGELAATRAGERAAGAASASFVAAAAGLAEVSVTAGAPERPVAKPPSAPATRRHAQVASAAAATAPTSRRSAADSAETTDAEAPTRAAWSTPGAHEPDAAPDAQETAPPATGASHYARPALTLDATANHEPESGDERGGAPPQPPEPVVDAADVDVECAHHGVALDSDFLVEIYTAARRKVFK